MTAEGTPLWCIVEPALVTPLEKALKAWGWTPEFITAPASLPQNMDGLLDEADAVLEAWAHTAAGHIPPIPEAILLVQAELMPGRRSAEHGLLLAERTWCEMALPTVIASIDPFLAQRTGARRARTPGGQPVLQLVSTGAAVQGPAIALWDLLSGKAGLSQAVDLAHSLFTTAAPGSLERLQVEISNAFVSRRTAAQRHRLEGLAASLRLLEGACLDGWITGPELQAVWEDLKPLCEARPDLASSVQKLQESFASFQVEAPAPAAPSDLEIWVCDDAWKTAGWEAVLQPLFCSRFGCKVRGFFTYKELLDALAADHAGRSGARVAALLLDVHLSETNPDEDVTPVRLMELADCFPLMDVILFTSEVHDGLLVRTAYERGFQFFFKSLEATPRNPLLYTRKLLAALEKAISAMPIRALCHLAEAGLAAVGEEDWDEAAVRLRHVLSTWRQNPDPTLVFPFVPLLEQQVVTYYMQEFTTGPPRADGRLEWQRAVRALQGVHPKQAAAWDLALRVLRLARQAARNTLAHDAKAVFDAGSLLPAIGLALPVTVASSTLCRTRAANPIGDQAWRRRLKDALLALCQSLQLSGARQPLVQGMLENIPVCAADREKSRGLLRRIGELAKANTELCGLSSDMGSIANQVKWMYDRLPPVTPGQTWQLEIYGWVVVLMALCVLDHAHAVLD